LLHAAEEYGRAGGFIVKISCMDIPKIKAILKDSERRLDLFGDRALGALEERINSKEVNGGEIKHYAACLIRGKQIRLTPEEVVRQLYLDKLMHKYGYSKERISVEYPVNFGREVKKADIVIADADRPKDAYIIIEVKKPKLEDGKEQLRSYCNGTGAPIGVWTNGSQISSYNRRDPNYFEAIDDIPQVNEQIADVINERFTLKTLVMKDKLATERRSLKDIILDMENEVLANAGVDVFEEVFKLIFTKLYDEHRSQHDKETINRKLAANHTGTAVAEASYENLRARVAEINDDDFRRMQFRNSGQTDSELKTQMQDLFDSAKKQWRDIFPDDSNFQLTDSHLAICVASLQNVKLFNSNLQIIDEAFEYLVNKSAKGEKGQYFTPRHVIDMCVKMLNPQRGEAMIDTAAGSCGFPVHTIFKITGKLFTNQPISDEDKRAAQKVFGIDFDERAVRVARTLNLIAGDGETNVLHLNTLDYERWGDWQKVNRRWERVYGDGFERLEDLRAESKQNRNFNFDVLMANPPFAGDIKETRLIYKYELGRAKNKVGRDILFIERNLDFLKPGGRMAIVLPQGRFNNTSDKYIREFISERARILAVVGLHQNTFKPHTGTKTSVLFLQKWDDRLCPRVDDYNIFFAVSENGGKDNSGDYIYLKDNDGARKLDANGHMIIDHDLHNHNGNLRNGVAEAFIQFAESEKLSFWR